MKNLLLDSGIVGAYINRRGHVFDRLQSAVRQGDRIGTCVPIIAEIVYGIENSASRDRNLHILQRNLSSLRIWPFDLAAAFLYGQIAADLKRRGRPMQVMDMMVAAVAQTMPNAVVVTTDSDFESIPKLAIERWQV